MLLVSSQCTWGGVFDKISGDDVSREMRKKTIAVEPTDTRIVRPSFNALKSEESSGASEYTSRAIDADTR